MQNKPRIAIIGAGLAGLCLARDLGDRADIVLFDKSRGIGGRMSTRRTDLCQFDHGAQYFTAHGADFRAFLVSPDVAGAVARWQPRLVRLSPDAAPRTFDWNSPRYVGIPSMNSLCKSLAGNLQIVAGTEISQISAERDGWTLADKLGGRHGGFDWVASTAPSVQTARLMPSEFSGTTALNAAAMTGCYSLMIGFEERIALDWDAAHVRGSPLQWIADSASKPGRTGQGFVCQTSNDWAEANLERPQDEVQDVLLTSFREVTGLDRVTPVYLGLHRWRYAAVPAASPRPYLLDPDMRLAACGDWCGAGRVESAFDSARALSRELAVHIG